MNHAEIKEMIREVRLILENSTQEQKIRIYEKIRLLKEYSDSKKDTERKNNSSEVEVNDPELDYLMTYAKKHYPSSKNKQTAFFKYVQRALKHSEDNDSQQNNEIDKIWQELELLKQSISKISRPSESDFVQES